MKPKKIRPEILDLLKQANIVSKKLKIPRQEALLLMISYELTCLHDHIDKVIFGIIASHAEKVEAEE